MTVLRYLLFIFILTLLGCNGESGSSADPIAVGGGPTPENPTTPVFVGISKKGSQASPTLNLPIEFRMVFSRKIDPASFIPADISFIGSATGMTFNIISIGDNQTFYIQVTNVLSPGTIKPFIAQNSVVDIFGNKNSPSTGNSSVIYNYVPLSVSINQQIAQADPAGTLPILYDVVFSEAIDSSTFDISDITQSGNATGITWNLINSGDDINFTLEATAVLAAGNLSPIIAAAAVQTVTAKENTSSTSADNTVLYSAGISVTIEQKLTQLDPAAVTPIEFDVVFSEAIDPLTFIPTDIVQGGSAGTVTWNIIDSGDQINFTLQALTIAGSGTVQPSLAAAMITNVGGLKDNLASTSLDNIVTYNNGVNVTIEQNVAQLDPTNTFPILFDVVFSEAIDPLTFLDTDIINGGTSTGLIWTVTDSGDQINFTIQASGGTDGTIIPSLLAGSVQTLALINNTASTSIDNSVEYDSIIPTVAIDVPALINDANKLSYILTGTCSENLIPVTVFVGAVTSAPICTGLVWSATMDVSSEADNAALAITVDHSDAALNVALQASTTTFKDTIIPLVAITGAVDINASNEMTYSVVGTCSENGEIVSLSIDTLNLFPICIGGAFTTGNVDVSVLGDNPSLPITADLSDIAGNPAIQASITILKDSLTPTVTIVTAPDISGANQTEYIASGLCSDNGQVVTVSVGGVAAAPLCSSGTWTTALLDVSGLLDGPITITADHLIATQASVLINKDANAPTVSINLAVNINPSNELIYSVSGGCSENGRIVDVFIDTLNLTPTCSNGGWTTGQVDVSSIPDGNSILITADHDNVALTPAVQATALISKQTLTPTIFNLSVPATLVFSADLSWTIINPGALYTINDHIINFRVKGTPTWLSFDDGVSAVNSSAVTSLLASTTYEFRVAVIYDTINQSDWSNIAEGITKVDNPLFNSPYKAMNVGGSTDTVVVAMQDATVITHTPYATGIEVPLTTLNKGQTFTFVSTQFDIIDADKPIYTAGRLGTGGNTSTANVTWSPTAWAGKTFSFNAIRNNPQQLMVYAVEDTTVTVKQGTTVLDTLVITAGNGGNLSWSVYGSYQVSSTGTILAYHYSGNAGTYVDPKPLLPSSLEIIGFPSNSMRITANLDSTNYNLIHADSVTASGSLNKIDSGNINPSGGGSSLYAGNSLLISADKNIAGASFADSNGNCAAPFLPTNLMKKNYAINVLSDWVAFASKLPGTIDVLDSAGTVIETLTLARSGANPNAPYKARRASTPAGYRFVATVPVAGWYQPNNSVGGATQDETILYGSD